MEKIVLPVRLLKDIRLEVGLDGDLYGLMYPQEERIYIAEMVPSGQAPRLPLTKVGTWSVCGQTGTEEAEPGTGLRMVIGAKDRKLRMSLDGREISETVEMVNDVEGLAARIRSRVDIKHLAQSRVAVFGAGRVGSQVAVLLAREQVGNFTLFDCDKAEPHNVSHSAFGLADVGRSKACAVRDVILSVNPDTKVGVQDADVRQLSREELAKVVRAHDLLVVAVDEPSFQRQVNDLAYGVKPAVYVALLGGGVGEVVFTRPNKNRCLRCCSNILERTRLEGADALGLETLPAIAVAAQVAHGLLLEGKAGGQIFASLLDDRRNLILVGPRLNAVLPVLDVIPKWIPMATVAVDTSRRPRGCEVCNRVTWDK